MTFLTTRLMSVACIDPLHSPWSRLREGRRDESVYFLWLCSAVSGLHPAHRRIDGDGKPLRTTGTVSTTRFGTRFEFLESSGKLLSLSLAHFIIGVSRRNIYRLEITLRWRQWDKIKRNTSVTSGPVHLTCGTGSLHSATQCDFTPL